MLPDKICTALSLKLPYVAASSSPERLLLYTRSLASANMTTLLKLSVSLVSAKLFSSFVRYCDNFSLGTVTTFEYLLV